MVERPSSIASQRRADRASDVQGLLYVLLKAGLCAVVCLLLRDAALAWKLAAVFLVAFVPLRYFGRACYIHHMPYCLSKSSRFG